MVRHWVELPYLAIFDLFQHVSTDSCQQFHQWFATLILAPYWPWNGSGRVIWYQWVMEPGPERRRCLLEATEGEAVFPKRIHERLNGRRVFLGTQNETWVCLFVFSNCKIFNRFVGSRHFWHSPVCQFLTVDHALRRSKVNIVDCKRRSRLADRAVSKIAQYKGEGLNIQRPPPTSMNCLVFEMKMKMKMKKRRRRRRKRRRTIKEE